MTETVQYICNGRIMPKGQERLSNVAYQYTSGIHDDEKRISTKELIDLLAELGVSDPRSTGWKAHLPNGVIVEAVAPTSLVESAPKGTESRTPAKKASKATKKTPGQKARAAKTATPKASTGRKVTTNFKESAKKS